MKSDSNLDEKSVRLSDTALSNEKLNDLFCYNTLKRLVGI